MTVGETERVTTGPAPTAARLLERPLKHLSLRHVLAIDDALTAVGAFGEVRLVVNRGKLRFIQTVRSEDLAAGEEPEGS